MVNIYTTSKYLFKLVKYTENNKMFRCDDGFEQYILTDIKV